MLRPNKLMASTRKSPPARRQRESQRLTLKVRTVSPPPRAGERRRSTPHAELDVPEALRPKRPDAKLTVNVIDVVTANLTKDPRHEK